MTHKVVKMMLPITVAILMAATMAFAKSYTIDISQSSKLGNGPTIKAGTYKVEILNSQSNPEAVFYRYGKEVAKVPVKMVEAPRKYEYTAVVSTNEGNKHVINELELRGWKEKVIFEGSGMPAKGGE